MSVFVAVVKKFWSRKRYIVLIATPLILLPILFTLPPKEGKCLFVVLLMAFYWCTEALPMAVTSLLPLVLFPFMGILPSSKVCPQYFTDTSFLFLSGLLMAAAIEAWNLHRRIALKVLILAGVKPARLILGMMITTAFLSMWLSNTATTAMVLPIGNAILKILFGEKFSDARGMKHSEGSSAHLQKNGGQHPVPTDVQLLAVNELIILQDKTDFTVEVQPDMKEEQEYQHRIWKALLISIPYSASIGGIATVIGTPPNLLLLGQLKSFFPDCDVVNFGSWFVFAFPIMILFLILGWLWISILHGAISLRKNNSEIRLTAEAKAKDVIRKDYRKLGPTTFAEKSLFFFFCLFVILLFMRDPKFIPGWASAFTPGFTSDAVTGITVAIILFFFPSKKPSLKWWFDLKAPTTEYIPLLSWKKAQDTVAWNILLLLGGGFAMAKGCEASGLSTWVGNQLIPLEGVPLAVTVLLVSILVALFTEFANNGVTGAVLLPILSELAIRINVNPLYLMIPGTVGCSFAFMLPVATPPNAIAFSTGHLLVKDMIKAGWMMNLMGVLLLSLAMSTWAPSIFHLDTFPDWVHRHSNNVTSFDVLHNITKRG